MILPIPPSGQMRTDPLSKVPAIATAETKRSRGWWRSPQLAPRRAANGRRGVRLEGRGGAPCHASSASIIW
jgi:hypothetical protein